MVANKHIEVNIMKKNLCLLILSVLVLLCSCGTEPSDSSDNRNLLVKTEIDRVHETTRTLNLPKEYQNFKYLKGMDEKYYYLADNDSSEWRYLRVSRDNLTNYEEYKSISKQYDIKLEYGYNGAMYVGILESLSEPTDEVDGDYDFLASPCRYRIMKLGRNSSTCIYQCESSGMPSVVPSGNHVIIEINIDGGVILEDLNLETGATGTIVKKEFTRDKKGLFNGTIIMGLDYDHMAPSENGICYQLCELQSERFDAAEAGNNTFYYYDFSSKKTEKLGKHYRPVEYVGGTNQIYLSSDYYGNLDDNFVKLYIHEDKNNSFQMYDFAKEDLNDPIMGTGILDQNIFLAYKESGFYLINPESKTYSLTTFSTVADILEKEELEALDYKDCVTGMFCYQKQFCFSTVSESSITIHEITIQ